MEFKIGDKVTISHLPGYIHDKTTLNKSGTIIEKCCVSGCVIVKLSNGKTYHRLTDWLCLTKNQQLLFEFYNDK